MALLVGITGGIGSGKTLVCKVLEFLGVPVYYADDRAKYLMRKDKKIIAAIKNLLGEKAYLKNGNLNRDFIAKQIFGNASLKDSLEAIVHPFVRQDGISWQAQYYDAVYAVKEAALMVESGSYKDMDVNVMVHAPLEVRIERVMARDGLNADRVKQRINVQMMDHERMKFCDFAIDNGGKHQLLNQVMWMDNKLRTLASR